MKKPIFMGMAVATFATITAFTSVETEIPRPAALPQIATAPTDTALVLSPIVDFDAYMALAAEVQAYRRHRLISLDSFNAWSKIPGTVILDTRSDSLYNGKHIKGAIHLDFSNFTQESLAAIIPDRNTRILIYCNNNFKALRFEPPYFVSKAIRPDIDGKRFEESELPSGTVKSGSNNPVKPLSLALNIPTFINLYGYGYKNVYELGEQVFVIDRRLAFEGSGVPK
jgi:hypothetical protein